MIVVAGEALIDLLVHPDGHLTAVPGGGPFNTARTIARLGGDGRLPRPAVDRPVRGDAARRAGRRRRRPPLGRRRPTRRRRSPSPSSTRSGDRDVSLPPRRDLGAGPGARRRAAGASGRGPGALHVGTLGLVARADRVGARPRASPRLDAETLVMVDPNCRPRVIARPCGLPRPARPRPRPGRRRQGQRRRPRLPRSGRAGARGRAGRCSAAGRRSSS